MFFRKCLAAYFTAWTLVYLFSFPFLGGMGGGHALSDYMTWVLLIAAYAVPGCLFYAAPLSALLESAERRWLPGHPVSWLVTGSLHVLFGLLCGFPLQSSFFSILGGTAAVVYYGFDRLIAWRGPHTAKRARAVWAAVPMAVFGILVLALYAAS
ncbi:hypothetical protein ACP26L_21810 [Paenibacillus sp. S-38]|uniref:hypothetical protein n=1 Tax=Paenibacillus sp. S-38 TaxID=3416710 RepID=UPI003CF79DFF